VGRRIAVIGTTGSGKTTLARRLATRLRIPHVELDALHWDAGWKQAPREVFRERVERALLGDRWVADGNYGVVRDIVWGRADTLVWLDYSLPVIMRRLVGRTFLRLVRREVLWNGNRESVRGALLEKDAIIIWALRTYRKRRQEFPSLFRTPEHEHLAVLHLSSPAAASRWLAALDREENRLHKEPVGPIGW
jgi:adenylate kinase family enzyme